MPHFVGHNVFRFMYNEVLGKSLQIRVAKCNVLDVSSLFIYCLLTVKFDVWTYVEESTCVALDIERVLIHQFCLK